MPEKVLIHWVIVKEPNKHTKFNGAIYFLIESAEKKKSSWLHVFAYGKDRPEPRLFALPYSRGLHEQVQNQMKGRLRKGQPILGSLSKIKGGEGKSKNGAQNPSNKKGGGSESQEQNWEFHELRPSDFLNKPNE
jgi:hypothetical protein|tara:strand:+ start:418 stop:819 length:402 start_codon:yes stop_codon:yes gene_type:complete